MRWLVEVSSIGKTDLQKFCVEAESWQRALQAARSQRGEEGPMSGFSIELLEEGYRAVDPVARVRFVVKRASDDAPITAPLAKTQGGVAPSPPSMNAPSTSAASPAAAASAMAAPTEPRLPPSPPSSAGAKPSVPPRPGAAEKSNGPLNPTKKAGLIASPNDNPPPSAAPVSIAPATNPSPSSAPPAPVGTQLPGLPPVKVLSAREQNPTEASPLTYREYSFAVGAGTSEDIAVAVLCGQLKLVDAHLSDAKMGKLVNLAVFDVEFSGKPPGPPIATLSWKDWKGDPVIGYPRRDGAQKQVKPPSSPPAAVGTGAAPAAAVAAPPAPVPAPQAAVAAPAPPTPAFPPVGAVAQAPSAAPANHPFPVSPSSIPPPNPFSATAPMIPQALLPHQGMHPASVPPPAQTASQPPAQMPVAVFTPGLPGSVPPPPEVLGYIPQLPPPGSNKPAASPAAAPAHEPPPRRPSQHPVSGDAMVRTPSGRFVRGRTTGDELITSLFESMHDLHFLRDALDGGQFCLALATEVLPARAALIHFYDVEKREWVIACTRGKETSRLLTLRTPEGDDLLGTAARKRRAVVTPNAGTASGQRYQTLGGSRSLIIAPIMQAGRALGAIEIINPLDGMPFTEDEGNAMTYIAEQYAEYLGSRGIVLDRARIQSAAHAR